LPKSAPDGTAQVPLAGQLTQPCADGRAICWGYSATDDDDECGAWTGLNCGTRRKACPNVALSTTNLGGFYIIVHVVCSVSFCILMVDVSALYVLLLEGFTDSFQKLYERCQHCVVKDGDYFEGQ
jgi:hypothetical protein